MIKIRLAKIDELDKLSGIEKSADQVFREISELAWIANDTEQYIERYRESILLGFCWVIVDDDTPIGFLSAEVIEDELHIWQLAVRCERQGEGYGSALIKKAIEMAYKHVLSAITLTTFSHVPWNAPFYARMGFNLLDKNAISERLKKTMMSEAEHGLPLAWRCAMRLEIDKITR
ncbi:GNAT family N-acetyltransferase [Brenneria roseae subsp. roseae]|uniref:GNAT family N-acetyltransferase n=1 Tax=Brenneria roseae TaxID=1509241 RepID=UPI000D609D55|nr:GNAT family N-acetyltransferase [Brenneria roseae]PWC22939.1 GNAT family N-acetyltransferase [Brenneria roseae subsp. roseae]